MSDRSVPEVLRGAWRRQWIRFADGTSDDTSIVLWMQFEEQMVDVRFSADRAELADRGGLDGCDLGDLLRLADSDSSSGHTTCTTIERNEKDLRTATAEWFSDPGVSFQPFTSFPEPGFLEWNDDGTVMIERAPSGDYTEEWHLVAGTAGGNGSIDQLENGVRRFSMGPLTVDVVDRTVSLQHQIENAPDLGAARALLDCEFTLAERNGAGEAVVTASTHPWRIGELL